VGLGGDDVLVSLPRPVGNVTYDEWHSALLGLLPGWVIGFGVLIGHDEVVFYLAIGILLTAGVVRARNIPKVGGLLEKLGGSAKSKCPNRATKAGGVIRREPWYFLTVLAITAAGTYGVGIWPWL
jgi:hypothetical protein